MEFGVDVSGRYAFHRRQSVLRLPGRLITESMKNQAALFGDGELVQTAEERFGLKVAPGLGVTGRQVGFAVHVIEHSHWNSSTKFPLVATSISCSHSAVAFAR